MDISICSFTYRNRTPRHQSASIGQVRIANLPMKQPSPNSEALDTRADLSIVFIGNRLCAFTLATQFLRFRLFPIAMNKHNPEDCPNNQSNHQVQGTL